MLEYPKRNGCKSVGPAQMLRVWNLIRVCTYWNLKGILEENKIHLSPLKLKIDLSKDSISGRLEDDYEIMCEL